MFGNSNSDLKNNSTVTVKRPSAVGAAIPDFSPPPTDQEQPRTPSAPTPSSLAPDLPELPVLRNATKPGQFRKTNYDPFSFGVKKTEDDENEGGEALIDSSLHRHLDLGLGFKRKKASGRPSGPPVTTRPGLKPSGSNPDLPAR